MSPVLRFEKSQLPSTFQAAIVLMRSSTALLKAAAAPSSLSLCRNIGLSPHGVARALSIAASGHRTSSNLNVTPSATAASVLAAGSTRLVNPAYTPTLRRQSSSAAPVPTSSLIQTSSLANGVRVASESTPGHFSAVGVYIDTGSRFERPWVPGESGVSHLLDRMAFKSTSQRSAATMTAEIEKLGGNVMCSSSRETIMYQSSMFDQDLPAVLSILADTIQHPLILPEELDAQKEAAAYEIGEIWNKPEMIIPELLHMVAYRDNTLGNPLLCPTESLQHMTVDNLRDFIKTWYRPERIVVAGAGMPHEQLRDLTQEFFGAAKASESVLDAPDLSLASSVSSSTSSQGSSPSSRTSSSSSWLSSAPTSPASSADFSTTAKQQATHDAARPTTSELAVAKARYTGGELYMPRDDLPFTHVYVAFEGVSIHDDDIYALATLQILLGGGSSFSAGGPGKGMYSRLYNVLNTQHAVDFCASFLHSYADSALFGIAAACEPHFTPFIGNVIAQQLEQCTGMGARKISQSELARARNQLKSSLMMALESRLVEVEDLGRQVQVHGKKVSVEEMCEKIDAVDVATLHRVARRVLRPQDEQRPLNHGLGNGQATVVAQGNLDGLGDIRQLLYQRGIGAKPTTV
ncbi:unnamed protein product [Parajaminaea phylloscopi]